MRSICFFSSYFTGENIPEYVKFYLIELVRHFAEVVYITNEKVIEDIDKAFVREKNIRLMLVQNEGYDFGMWQKGLNSIDVTQYDRVGLVNDSCILFNRLDSFFSWLNNGSYDYCGLTESNMPVYHLQSYFLVVNRKAIPMVKEYMDKNGPKPTLKEVIKTYELGLSDHLLKGGMNVAAYYKVSKKETDPTWMQAKELINNGYPLIKKRIIARNYGEADYRYLVANGFDAHPSHYIRLIKRVTGNKNEVDKIFSGIITRFGFVKELEFQFMCFAASIYSMLRRGTRKTKPGVL